MKLINMIGKLCIVIGIIIIHIGLYKFINFILLSNTVMAYIFAGILFLIYGLIYISLKEVYIDKLEYNPEIYTLGNELLVKSKYTKKLN